MALRVHEVAELIGGRLVNASAVGSALDLISVVRPGHLASSQAENIAFFFSKYYQADLLSARAGILVTGEEFVGPLQASGLPLWKQTAIIACRDPYLAMAVLSERFAESLSSVVRPSEATDRAPEIHPTAIVHPSAKIGPGSRIGPGCVIERDVQLGRNCELYANVYLGPGVRTGADCVFFPQVTLYEWTVLGDRCRLHAGAVIGADGFGYAPKLDDQRRPIDHQKIYHLGRVVIGSDVEIGANSCIDRGTLGDTLVADRVKIDNLVQVGHNAEIGEGAVLCGKVGVSGSAKLGKFVYIGGNTGIGNKIHIGDYARVGACSMISKNIPEGGVAVGNPQREHQEHFRVHAFLNKLVKQGRSGRRKAKGEGES